MAREDEGRREKERKGDDLSQRRFTVPAAEECHRHCRCHTRVQQTQRQLQRQRRGRGRGLAQQQPRREPEQRPEPGLEPVPERGSQPQLQVQRLGLLGLELLLQQLASELLLV